MNTSHLHQKAQTYLQTLCVDIPERCVGSEGNRQATRFFAQEIAAFGWEVEAKQFNAMDWENSGASLRVDGADFDVLVSPYALGCDVESQLVSASSTDALAGIDVEGKILLLHGEIAKEQLMPKNFVFYNPEEHQHIISLLENGKPAAIVCATGRNAALAGGVYPFPLIEDGDFDIPSVYMTEEEGLRLLPRVGGAARLRSDSKRIAGTGENVIAHKGRSPNGRIVVSAHIDAKKGTPGAIDNATGVVILLLLADLLKDYAGERQVEIVAFNGEDYYAVPGQMLYLRENQDRLGEIFVNINIDGAGYKDGKSAFSFYELSDEMKANALKVLSQFEGIVEGPQWFQGDHSIFIQNGRPAIAVSSEWFTTNVDSQEITHTPKDNPSIVDARKVVEITEALNVLVRKL
jgi:aminopeptidase YwaD